MTVKLSYREIRNHKRLYGFVLLQLVLTYLVCIGCVSVCLSGLKQYRSFQHYYNRDGWFLMLRRTLTEPNSDVPISEGKVLERYLKSAKVEACYNLGVNLERNGRELGIRSLAYDDDIVKSYSPELQEGKWLTVKEKESDVIEAVISPNQWGIGVGDTIDIMHPQKKLQAKIVGVLKNGTEIYDFNITDQMVSCRNLFYKLDYLNGDVPVLLTLHNDMERMLEKYGLKKIMTMSSGPVMVMYSKDITEEEKLYNQAFLENNAILSIEERLGVMREKSRSFLFSELSRLAPILAGVFLLTLISSVSASILITKQQMKKTAIFHLLGLPWRRCIRIQSVSLLSLMAAGLLFTIAGIWFFQYGGIWQEDWMALGIWQLAACLLLSLVYILVSCALQICLMGRNTTAEMLRQENGN